MLQEYKTRVIVLHTIKHSETGHILYGYAENMGRVTYYVNGTRKGRPVVGKNKVLLQPLTVLEVTGSKNSGGELHRIKEATLSYLARGLFCDIRKSTIALFMAEVVYRIVKEPIANQALFDYLDRSIRYLDTTDENVSNYHLFFLCRLTCFLGFMPCDNYQQNTFFDIKRGEYVVVRPSHTHYIDQEYAGRFAAFFSACCESEALSIVLTRQQRVYLLQSMIDYLGFHHDAAYKIASIKIFSEIF